MSHTEGPLGSSVHDAAQRAADIIDVLVPRPGSRDEAARLAMPRPPDERERLIAVLAKPFDERPGLEAYAAPPSADEARRYRTYCGT